MLLRDGEAGMEVLLLRRSRSAGFVPGAYVFPGGGIDAADAADETLAFLDGLTWDEAAQRLGLFDRVETRLGGDEVGDDRFGHDDHGNVLSFEWAGGGARPRRCLAKAQ